MTLAQRQADLVAALVAGAPVPAGFDEARVRVAADALVRKRAGEVARQWPLLRASLGPEWTVLFGAWARGRPPRGSLRDGWDFARTVELAPAAARELASRELRWTYDGVSPPRRRRAPAARWVAGSLAVQVLGRVWWLSPRWSSSR